MVVALSALAWFHPVKHLQAKRYFNDPGSDSSKHTAKEGYAPANGGSALQV